MVSNRGRFDGLCFSAAAAHDCAITHNNTAAPGQRLLPELCGPASGWCDTNPSRAAGLPLRT
jgi:hypothetical protein